MIDSLVGQIKAGAAAGGNSNAGIVHIDQKEKAIVAEAMLVIEIIGVGLGGFSGGIVGGDDNDVHVVGFLQ